MEVSRLPFFILSSGPSLTCYVHLPLLSLPLLRASVQLCPAVRVSSVKTQERKPPRTGNKSTTSDAKVEPTNNSIHLYIYTSILDLKLSELQCKHQLLAPGLKKTTKNTDLKSTLARQSTRLCYELLRYHSDQREDDGATD